MEVWVGARRHHRAVRSGNARVAGSCSVQARSSCSRGEGVVEGAAGMSLSTARPRLGRYRECRRSRASAGRLATICSNRCRPSAGQRAGVEDKGWSGSGIYRIPTRRPGARRAPARQLIRPLNSPGPIRWPYSSWCPVGEHRRGTTSRSSGVAAMCSARHSTARAWWVGSSAGGAAGHQGSGRRGRMSTQRRCSVHARPLQRPSWVPPSYAAPSTSSTHLAPGWPAARCGCQGGP